MKQYFVFLFFLSGLQLITAQPEYSNLSSKPGAFSRMGFGARGMGMGNAMSAVTEGNLVSYYNPALSAFQEGNMFQSSYSFLSLDRSLNFINFTRKFEFYSSRDTSRKKPNSTAGISLGIINSGVGKIDGRDNDGSKTGDLSTSENQFFLGLSNRFSEKFAVGLTAKVYYYKLYEDINSTGFGFDFGILYRLNDQWNFSLMISDLNTKYEWNTAPVYDIEGSTSTDNFPVLKKIGLRYRNNEIGLIAAAEFENSNAETNIIRAGAEYNVIDQFFIRAGVDNMNLSNMDYEMNPSAGFSYFYTLDSVLIGIDYAFVFEPYSPFDRHIVGISVNF
ncbi:MAG: hypothetical protein ACM34N_01460 [Ignavibacteria bacterium]